MRAQLLALLLVSAAFAIAVPVRGATTYDPSTFEADPGTIAGAIASLYDADDSRATVSEEDTVTTSPVTARIAPTANGAFGGGWNSAPCQTDAFWWDELDDPTSPGDGDTTCRRAAVGPNSQQTLTNIMADVAISGEYTDIDVVLYSEVRKESGNDVGTNQCSAGTVLCIDYTFAAPAVGCSGDEVSGTTSTSYVVLSATLEGCGVAGGPPEWDADNVNGLQVGGRCENVGDLSDTDICRITNVAADVLIYDSDYAVQSYVNFTGVSGTSIALDYECQTSLAGGDTLSLQVLQSGGYVTIATSVCGAGVDALAQYNLDTQRDVIDGAVSFRIIDTTTTDATGESFALDMFVLTVETSPPPPPGGGDLLRLECIAGIWSVDCTVSMIEPDPVVPIRRSAWYVDGQPAQTIDARAYEHHASLGSFRLEGDVAIRVDATMDDGVVITLETTVHQDARWIAVVLVIAIVAVVLLGVRSRARRSAARRRNEDRKKERDERRKFYGEIFK